MRLALIKNTDEKQTQAYKIARVVYAHTGGASLPLVEAMTSMIQNAALARQCRPVDIASDASVFDALRDGGRNHELMQVCAADRGFQMCLRVVQKMLRGNLSDCCHGATRFHHADTIPQWAVDRGYIADIDEILFYL